MGTPRTMRSARWKREANSLIFSHVAVSTGVIVSPETPLYLASIASASNSGSCSCQIFNLSIVTSRTCSLYSERKCIDDSGGRRFFLSRRGHYVQDIHFRCPSHVGCTDLKLFRPSSTREGVIGNSGVAISLGNDWKLLRASLRRSASTYAARAAAWLVSKAPIASTNATPVSAMPAASAASVCNFIIDQTPGLIFLRSAYEVGGGAHRPRPAWSSARPLA